MWIIKDKCIININEIAVVLRPPEKTAWLPEIVLKGGSSVKVNIKYEELVKLIKISTMEITNE